MTHTFKMIDDSITGTGQSVKYLALGEVNGHKCRFTIRTDSHLPQARCTVELFSGSDWRELWSVPGGAMKTSQDIGYKRKTPTQEDFKQDFNALLAKAGYLLTKEPTNSEHEPIAITAWQTLDVSTHHVSEKTTDWLQQHAYSSPQEHGGDPNWISTTPYGWFLHADEEPDAEVWPEDILRLMQFARKMDCSYILLDRDGETYSELPTYDW